MNWFNFILPFKKKDILNFADGAEIEEAKSLLIALVWMCVQMVMHLRRNWVTTHTGQIKVPIWKGSHDFTTNLY